MISSIQPITLKLIGLMINQIENSLVEHHKNAINIIVWRSSHPLISFDVSRFTLDQSRFILNSLRIRLFQFSLLSHAKINM